MFPTISGHVSWTTAFGVECLGGNKIEQTPAASPPIRAAVKGPTGLAIRKQGLVDSGDRSEAVHTLSYLRSRGIELDPDALMVEAPTDRRVGH